MANKWRQRLADLQERPVVRAVVGPVRILAGEWRKDRPAGLAAEVAFWAALSMFPLLLALAAALGFLDLVVSAEATERTRDQVAEWVTSAFGSSSGVSENVNDLFGRTSPGLLSFSLLVLLWAASRAFGALIRALDVIYGLSERRSWLNVRLTALALAVGSVMAAAVAIAAVVVGPLLGRGPAVADAVGLGGAFATAWTWGRIPFVVIVLVAWATTVFHFGPHHRTRWRDDLPGAICATVLWMIGHFGLFIYLELVAGSANAVFGVLGGALTLLLWLYVLALGTLLGAELNSQLERRSEENESELPRS